MEVLKENPRQFSFLLKHNFFLHRTTQELCRHRAVSGWRVCTLFDLLQFRVYQAPLTSRTPVLPSHGYNPEYLLLRGVLGATSNSLRPLPIQGWFIERKHNPASAHNTQPRLIPTKWRRFETDVTNTLQGTLTVPGSRESSWDTFPKTTQLPRIPWRTHESESWF